MSSLFHYTIDSASTFERTFKKEKDKLFQYASYRMHDLADAEDLVQDLFLKLATIPNLPGKAINLKAYIFRTLINMCNERCRKENSLVSISDFPEFDIQELTPNNFDEEFSLINKLLNHLPSEQNVTIRLRIYAGLTFKEIGRTMEVSTSTAKARFRYGINKLRDGLKRQNLL